MPQHTRRMKKPHRLLLIQETTHRTHPPPKPAYARHLDLGLLVERGVEELDGGVADVIVRRNHAQVESRHVVAYAQGIVSEPNPLPNGPGRARKSYAKAHSLCNLKPLTVLFDGHTLALLKISDDVFDKLREMVGYVPVRGARHVVVVRVLRQTPAQRTTPQSYAHTRHRESQALC